MTCVMCPRTTEMHRKIEHMSMSVFKKVSDEISHHNTNTFNDWVCFIEKELGVYKNEKGEIPFYYYISSQAVTMHGFGEPLLDPFLKDRVEILANRGIPTYLSCNPSNINTKKIESLFQAGLNYIKFSIDSLSDEKMKEIRGPHANYNHSHRKIMQLLDIKEKEGYDSTIVVCMIKLSKKQNKEADKFLQTWKDKNVFSYIKSQDNQWYFQEQDNENAKSHYASQYCEFPWTSLSVMVDGTVVPCTQDYNCEMSMGNIKDKSLKEIWNSDKYREFRKMHVKGKFPGNYRCRKSCDLKIVADYLM